MNTKRWNSHGGSARGVTLLEVVVTVAILAVLGTVIVPAVESSSRIGGEAKRADDAAAVLADLRDASVRYNLGDVGSPSFASFLSGTGGSGGINPGRLSHLTNKISITDLNSCGGVYTSTQVTRWQGVFYPGAIVSSTPMSTYQVAPGFIADDTLARYNQSGTPLHLASNQNLTTPGTLAIVMRNVALSDALALAARMEGDRSGGVNSIVRFTPNGTLPINVYYHMEIHGC